MLRLQLRMHTQKKCSRSVAFVFKPTHELAFAQLDQHAESLDLDIKLPLVVLGDEGNTEKRDEKHVATKRYRSCRCVRDCMNAAT